MSVLKKKAKSTILISPLIYLILSLNPAYAEISEYDLKAVFLERFTRFVEWPADSNINDPTKPFILGVVGKNQFGSRIEEISDTLRIRDKRVVVRYISQMGQIDGCHLLFISGKTRLKVTDIVNFTKDKPILMVSDTKGYANKGVYINYFFEKDKLRFEINQTAVTQSKLKMSSMLLQRARILNPIKDNQ